ncbi:UPF0678 fatty acid-binding protein-like protein At1g79260 isoform X2 [Prunus persica]|uniref:UPF0678 fatty acid-binding protein-like protein At1g79260 isoform X2 n=1 Tax=Prunus persica TaxID=3760 RepID=UPI0009AB8BE3|nr:UPF0678 fatty acid-binding protein-like protein At1g79260 isoform X2 [Prunus persica]
MEDTTESPAIHPAIAPLSYLLGTWRGQGEGGFPTINSFSYVEQLHFSHSGKPFIAYTQKTWKLNSGEPMHAESGFWRPKPDGTIEVVISQSTGLVEVQHLRSSIWILILSFFPLLDNTFLNMECAVPILERDIQCRRESNKASK